jgi:hypothetical protein
MGFLSGSVSFSRFSVIGGSPKRLDDNLMDKFRAHAIGKQKVMRSDREETGWIGGRHLLDREFGVEKNVILDCLHFGLRIDSARVPPDLLRAYVQQEFDAVREKHGGNGNGRSLARLRKQATEAARHRAEQEIKEGRFRSQRQFPILWDTRNDVLFVAAAQPAVIERLQRIFRETFDKRLEPLTAGRAGYQWADQAGQSRRIESARPACFVPHPDGNGHAEVFWATKDPASRDYLGNEFLLWLWHTLSEETDSISLSDQGEAAVVIVKHITVECPWAQFGRAVITADGPSRLAESRRAIATGKLPRRIGLLVTRQEEQYEFILQAETLTVSAAVLPPVEENGRTRVEERVEQVRHLSATVDLLFQSFLARRLSSDWPSDLERIAQWLREDQAPRGKRALAAATI